MNAYAVCTPNEVCLYHETEIDPAEYGLVYEVVFAESRSQARNALTHDWDLDYLTPLHIHKLADNVVMPGREWSEPDEALIALYVQAAVHWYGLSEIEEWQQWQSWYDSDPESAWRRAERC